MPEINALDQEVEKRAQQGEQVIPGKQFCRLAVFVKILKNYDF